MTLSMTAFARISQEASWGSLTCELRSVNHRFLELTFKLPEELRQLEPVIRDLASRRLARGKVDCHLRLQFNDATSATLKLDEKLAAQLIEVAYKIDVMAKNISSLRAADLMRWPGVLITPRVDPEALTAVATEVVTQALAQLVETRVREGERLGALLNQRLNAIAEILTRVEAITPTLAADFRQRLQARLAELKQEVNPERLEQEIVLFAQRADVTEEVDRLRVHVAEIQRALTQSGQVGRRLDFLMQELNREANTLTSKSSDLRLTSAAVDLKVLIEQMREQVQNIE